MPAGPACAVPEVGTLANQPVIVPRDSLLAPCIDLAGDLLSVFAVSQSTSGASVALVDGEAIYTPLPDFVGADLIEAISYRLGDHTTADDATRYRDPDVVRQQWALEPIARLRNYLVRANAWGKEQEDRLLKECSEAINQAVGDYLATPAPATEAMFDHLYAQLPDAMREQRATALRFAPTIGERDG